MSGDACMTRTGARESARNRNRVRMGRHDLHVFDEEQSEERIGTKYDQGGDKADEDACKGFPHHRQSFQISNDTPSLAAEVARKI